MKLLVVFVVVGLLGIVLLFGFSAVVDHAATTADEIKEEIEGHIPTSHDLSYSRRLLRERVQGLAQKRVEIAHLESRCQDAASSAETKESEIEKFKRELAIEGELLATPKPSYEIGGRAVSHERLQADARRRLRLLDQKQGELESIFTTARALRAAAEQGRKALEKAEIAYRDRFAELNVLESSIENGEMVGEANGLTISLEIDAGVDSELANALQRIRAKEREVWAIAGGPIGGSFEQDILLDLSPDPYGIDGSELQEEIAKALGRTDPSRRARESADEILTLGD